MSERIKELIAQAMVTVNHGLFVGTFFDKEKFAELIVEATLDQVKERAYYTGDRDWSDEVDRPWIQLEFGYGTLHNAKHAGVEE